MCSSFRSTEWNEHKILGFAANLGPVKLKFMPNCNPWGQVFPGRWYRVWWSLIICHKVIFFHIYVQYLLIPSLTGFSISMLLLGRWILFVSIKYFFSATLGFSAKKRKEQIKTQNINYPVTDNITRLSIQVHTVQCTYKYNFW